MAKSTSQGADRRSPDRQKAERIYLESKGQKKLVDIAKEINREANTVRKWKSMDDWDGTLHPESKKKQVERSTSPNGSAPPRKRGGQPGNKNAVGGRGNPHPKTKHGGYVPVYYDTLDEEEKELFDLISSDPEAQLIDEIRLYTIRERRIMKAIDKYKEQQAEIAISEQTRVESKRTFANEKEEADYKKRMADKVKKGERLPGEGYQLETHTTNKDMVVARLEQELSTVQGKKNKVIDSLYKLRMEAARIESENIGGAAVDDWIAGIMGGGNHE